MNSVVQGSPRPGDLFSSYVALTLSLVPELSGICILDRALNSWGAFGDFTHASPGVWIKTLRWSEMQCRVPAMRQAASRCWTALPIEQSDGALLGVFCTSEANELQGAELQRRSAELARCLEPLLACVHRDLGNTEPAEALVQALTERTAELEWLFNVTSNLNDSLDDQGVMKALLQAATERLESAFGVLSVPDRRLRVKHVIDTVAAESLSIAWDQTQPHLMAWVQRQSQPLVVNHAGYAQSARVPCKLMCVPIMKNAARVIGVLAFYNPPEAPDFSARHVFLAQHIGRQAASIVEAQIDLMTGLYTRSGLDQIYDNAGAAEDFVERSLLYLDIDHMHIANELHGFELGNELIIRVAELLSAPLLPSEALAARISGDRFAVILPNCSSQQAATIAHNVQIAASKALIGPSREAFDVSVSCGISVLLPMQDGVARAIAAAELACKTAKNRGRNRVEMYQFEDGSMMRRHRDAMAVGQLRAALKADRLLLYAQRIAPLKDLESAGGYELLLRLRETDGTLVAPGPLIEAAQRYQILPAIDRWVVQRALQALSPYRAVLRTRKISISINVSGQSIGDENFVEQLALLLRDASLPKHCVCIELTEQAAITNMARGVEMVSRLSALGCRMALDDFGTGANSLAYLKALQVYRVKIDGSFVRDLLTDRNSQATVRSIVELARGIGIETVAEYVENDAIAAEVRRLGVDYAQGYAFGRPEPLQHVLQTLSEDESQRMHKLILDA